MLKRFLPVLRSMMKNTDSGMAITPSAAIIIRRSLAILSEDRPTQYMLKRSRLYPALLTPLDGPSRTTVSKTRITTNAHSNLSVTFGLSVLSSPYASIRIRPSVPIARMKLKSMVITAKRWATEMKQAINRTDHTIFPLGPKNNQNAAMRKITRASGWMMLVFT